MAKFEGKIHGEMNQRAKKRAKPETTRMPLGIYRVRDRDAEPCKFSQPDHHHPQLLQILQVHGHIHTKP